MNPVLSSHAVGLSLCLLLGGCVATPAVAEQETTPEVPPCIIAGVPLESIPDPGLPCFGREGLMPQPLADALRLFASHRLEEAVALLEPYVSGTPDPAELMYWWGARWFLARFYLHLGRTPEAETLLLASVATPDDYFRQASARLYCHQDRGWGGLHLWEHC